MKQSGQKSQERICFILFLNGRNNMMYLQLVNCWWEEGSRSEDQIDDVEKQRRVGGAMSLSR